MPAHTHPDSLARGSRTLPLRVAPVAGEALDSWLEAIAHRYSVALGDVLSHCGIRHMPRTALAPVTPARDELRRICNVCDIDTEAIRTMTLLRCRGAAADIGDPLRWSANPLWIRRSGSRFCPHCLRESGGRWQLVWRLNWSFACVKHRCLLADLCPACGTPLRRQPLCASRIPNPSRCPRSRYSPAEHALFNCNAELGATDVLPMQSAHPVLKTQTTIDALLNGNRADFTMYADTSHGCDDVLSDIRLLAGWVMAAVEQQHLDRHFPTDFSSAVGVHRQSTSWPYGRYWRSVRAVPSALDTAAGVTVALSLVSLPDAATATAALQRLMENASNGGPYRLPVSRQGSLTPTVRSVVDVAHARHNADLKLQSRLARRLATPHSVRPGSALLAR
jgi:hypothetical protein